MVRVCKCVNHAKKAEYDANIICLHAVVGKK